MTSTGLSLAGSKARNNSAASIPRGHRPIYIDPPPGSDLRKKRNPPGRHVRSSTSGGALVERSRCRLAAMCDAPIPGGGCAASRLSTCRPLWALWLMAASIWRLVAAGAFGNRRGVSDAPRVRPPLVVPDVRESLVVGVCTNPAPPMLDII
jgi:hypothetical protein